MFCIRTTFLAVASVDLSQTDLVDHTAVHDAPVSLQVHLGRERVVAVWAAQQLVHAPNVCVERVDNPE